MSTGCKSSHNGFLDVSRSNGGLYKYIRLDWPTVMIAVYVTLLRELLWRSEPELGEPWPFYLAVCFLPPYIEGYIGCCVFSLSGDGGTDRPEILHYGTYRSRADILHFSGLYPRGIAKSEILGLNFGYLTANISKMVSCSITCQLELNSSSTRAF